MIGTGSHDVFSTVLEGAQQIHARAVPWTLAEGCVSSVQPRYVAPIETRDHYSRSDTNTLQVPGLVWGDGASCCSIIERKALTCLFQVLRNGGPSHHDYARVKIQD